MSIEHKLEKPSSEAKAVSLYLMVHKSTSSAHKEKSKRINKQWHRVIKNELSREEYLKEVNTMLKSFGGYSKVVEETVQHYIAKTGVWKLKGDRKLHILIASPSQF